MRKKEKKRNRKIDGNRKEGEKFTERKWRKGWKERERNIEKKQTFLM